MTDIDNELYGNGLLENSLAPKRQGNLSEKFIIPPFTILSARENWWQSRKRAWIALSIKSELGRGGDLLALDGAPQRQQTYREKAAPGGSLMPDTDYSRRERGNSTGKAIEGTAPVIAERPIQAPIRLEFRKPAASAPAPPAQAPKPVEPMPIAAVPLPAPSAPAPRPAQAAVSITMRPRGYGLSQAPAPVTAVPSSVGKIPYTDPFLAAHADVLAAAGADPIAFDEPWEDAPRSAVGVDVECFVNFFVVCFRRFSDGKRLAFERSRRGDFDRDALIRILNTSVLVSFNGASYDLPMIYLALSGADTVALKAASDRIVKGNVKPWTVEKEIGVKVPRLNHIDLIEANPAVRQSLKIIAGRLHARWVVDLPYSPDAMLSPEQMNVVTLYCMESDLPATELLYRSLREPLELRAALGKQHGMDLRSKSDSQIGEALVKKQVEAALGRRIERAQGAKGAFGYTVPEFVRFDSEQMRGVLDKLRTARFHVNAADKIVPPAFLEDLKVKIGNMTYNMGIGGLHSTETHRALRSDNDHFLIDTDVASQYPAIVMKLGLYPPAMGPKFLDIYGRIIDDRLAAQAAGNRTMADGGKIMLNGVFGKLGSSYSALYAPDLMIAITLTGQLAILMLVERAEGAGITVVSANTDGVVFQCSRPLAPELGAIVSEWEEEIGFTVRRTPYRAIYNQSVNTYIAIGEDGKIKRKGAIADPWSDNDLRTQMQKNPQMTVCSEALVRYLTDAVPFAETIEACRDPRMFVTVTRVTGGATWRSHKLGRAVRYYWSTDGDPILAADGKRKVAKTDGARPLVELTDRLPDDVDRDRYLTETNDLAVDFGIISKADDALL